MLQHKPSITEALREGHLLESSYALYPHITFALHTAQRLLATWVAYITGPCDTTLCIGPCMCGPCPSVRMCMPTAAMGEGKQNTAERYYFTRLRGNPSRVLFV